MSETGRSLAAEGAQATDIRGALHYPHFLDEAAQTNILAALRAVVAEAPLVQPMTAWGKPMSVRMTAAGRVGWVIDRGKYRYAESHQGTGRRWPAIPAQVLAVWHSVAGWRDDPDCCLINWYAEGAKMGLHRDSDEGEDAFAAPVVSISLGDPARFRIGGPERKGPTESVILSSGDVLVMGGAARLAYHGVDRVYHGEGTLIPGGGRLNLTLRVVKSA
ncbi:MAG: alpha-ketoglutarate-dependent dioxygenase AlkB [Pseudomonadota bacterium]